MNFVYPKSIPLANLPTPIQKLARANQSFPGHNLYLKRDDWTGCSFSGNKIRKLEFEFAQALAQGAHIVITCGGVQSNHARATAVAAARLGLQSHLVLRGDPEPTPTGNFLIDRLAGSHFTFISADDYRHRVGEIMTEVAAQYRDSGQTAFIIPEGASDALGAMGYVRAAEEIGAQLKRSGLKIDYIVSAVGSGGTLAGLLLGKKLFGLDAEIVGINVCDSAEFFNHKIRAILTAAETMFHLEGNFDASDIHIIDGYVGKGYGLSTPDELKFIQTFASSEGIILDPVYTGKAMYGLFQELEKGRFERNSNFLFLHTGGIYEIFAKAADFAGIFTPPANVEAGP